MINLEDKKNIVLSLNDDFVYAGELSLKLRNKGLIETIKSDNSYITDDE